MEFGYVKCCHGNVLTNSLQQAAYHISWLNLVCERNTYFSTNILICTYIPTYQYTYMYIISFYLCSLVPNMYYIISISS